MTDLPFQEMTKGLNDSVVVASLQTHEPIQHPTSGLSRLTKIALFVSLSLAILIMFASTAAGTRILGHLGMRASAAELASEARGDAKSGNVLTAFLSRSPGERGVTDAIKGKAKGDGTQSEKVANVAPKQRALGKVFDKPASKVAAAALPQPVLEFLPANIASETDSILASVPPVLGGSSIFAPVIGGGIGGGGGFIGGGGGGGSGGGGGGSGGNVTNPPPVLAVASAVPEPSTWILLLLGFAAIGASIRRPKSANPLMLRKVESCAAN